MTVKLFQILPAEKIIKLVKRRFNNFKPLKVRRIFIPKDNGTQRVIGILAVEDRIIQQCIKQVLEPICEAKFHPDSFGFRPLRSARHAVNQMIRLLQMTKYDYCVDIDIKNFFDNVNHEILIKQIYNLGINDKKLLSIISKILKVYVEGEGIKTAGLVQGANLSPLLSNIVLNDLDRWLNLQCKTENLPSADNRIYFVRYADDFKILCKNFSDAFKVFNAVKIWLKENLKLDISPDKSKILNLKTQGSEFLGFKIKVTAKNGVYSVESHISDGNKLKIQNNLCSIISRIGNGGKNAEQVLKTLNRQIILAHSYYQSASHVQQDFIAIAESCQNLIDERLNNFAEKVPFSFLGKNIMTYKINDTILIPPECVTHKRLENLPHNINIYAPASLKKCSTGKRHKFSKTKYKFRQMQNSLSKIETSAADKKSSENGMAATIKKYFSNFLNAVFAGTE